MLLSISILAALCLVISILSIIQSKRNQQRNLEIFKELKQQINLIEQIPTDTLNKLSTDFQKSNYEHFNQMINSQTETQVKIQNQISQELLATKNEVSTQLKNELHTYIHYDDEEQINWTQLIKSQKNQRTKLQYLESALNKFPNNRNFFEMYIEILNISLENASTRAKQIIIEKMNHSSRIFFDTCLAKDASYAQQKKDEIIRLGHKFMEESDKEQENKFNTLINQLEQLVISSKTNIEEIEEIDTQINVAILKNYPDLLKRYQQITSKIAEQLIEKPSDEQVKSYNLEAVESFRLAQTYFQNNQNKIKKGESLDFIISLLGGWDTQYLSPPAQIYYQSVYSDIFSKLDPDIKPEMTKEILNIPNKEV